MKKVLLLAAALLLISSAASAGWLDIFADTGRTSLCHYPSGLYMPVDIYFYARPPADGFMATECKIVMPDPCAVQILEELHPDVNLTMGDWPTGKSVSFAYCQLDPWVLVCHLRWLTTDCAWSPDCQTILLGPRDDSGFLGFATCASGFPPEVAGHQFDVYLNCTDPELYPCAPVATHEKSWGAIKNLYSE